MEQQPGGEARIKVTCNFCQGTGELFNGPCLFCARTGKVDPVDHEVDEYFGTEMAKMLRNLDHMPQADDEWRTLHKTFLKALRADRVSERLSSGQVNVLETARQQFTRDLDNRLINKTAACMRFLVVIDGTLTPEQHGYAPF